ncbi:ABC transporter ATP-binding protein [Paenibacillus sp. FSL H8-0548]|uniref:ABC transporter ATP-binding protein n=1 Tax=Paenibacillus sp. FSL H8-0548 TaxID=1920422 RepID=UPI00096FA9F4|nr:ABC transporter ATP-binding protein [Paenibacillus sp. FSL H8-0548]OMF31729.1 ABC transporter ATP-binding protein [Paenibacillus sp. FSL H8-0548]
MLLHMEGITKSYGSVTANSHVHFSLQKGEIHALVGENGAGKTTLMRILYGMESPTSGQILLGGKPVSFASPADAIKHKIGMVHQHFMLFPTFTIAENIVIGREPSKGVGFDRKAAALETERLGKLYGMPVDPWKKVADCSLGMQQRVEILKVLYQGAEVIILDEPTGVLTPLEVKELLIAIKGLAAQGKSFILISHKLQEIMEVADRVTVLRDGKVTGTVDTKDTNTELLSRLMVGRELVNISRNKISRGKPVLEVSQLTISGAKAKPVLANVSLHVDEGEIVGIAGISGNGQSELIQSISGLLKPEAGTVKLRGQDITGAQVGAIRRQGLAHIPEDRYQWGVAKDATVTENGLMGHASKHQKYGMLNGSSIRKMVGEWVTRFGIKTGSLSTKAQYLSGGNLQKLIVARELAQKTPFLIAAEPTRGVDVGAMEIIHGELLAKRDERGAILLVSSELTEILKLSDRILVMYEGEIVGELDAETATEEQISLLMAGGKAVG